MKEKVTDMEEMKKDSKERVQKALKESGMAAAISGNSSPKSTGFDAPSTSSADGKVNVITILSGRRGSLRMSQRETSRRRQRLPMAKL